MSEREAQREAVRTWYLNSERPVTEAEAEKGILCTWPWEGKMKKPERFDYIPQGMSRPSAYWMPDEWPEPPKPREKSQAEQDFDFWCECKCGITGFAVRIRADQEAKTRELLRKEVEKVCGQYGVVHCQLERGLRAIFDKPTTQEGTQ